MDASSCFQTAGHACQRMKRPQAVEIMHGGSCACMCQEVEITVRHDHRHAQASVQQREAGLLPTTSCGGSESLHVRVTL
jgi:hypothetical protein